MPTDFPQAGAASATMTGSTRVGVGTSGGAAVTMTGAAVTGLNSILIGGKRVWNKMTSYFYNDGAVGLSDTNRYQGMGVDPMKDKK